MKRHSPLRILDFGLRIGAQRSRDGPLVLVQSVLDEMVH